MRRAAALVVALLLPAGAAEAATVDTYVPPDGGTCWAPRSCDPVLRVTAASGERNVLDVAWTPDGRFVVHDAGAPLTPAVAGCVSVDPQTVACTTGARTADVFTGDGDDVVTGATSAQLGAGDDRFTGSGFADGGPGDDELRATRAPAQMSGGPGDDLLSGTDGDDRLRGGGGRDTLLGGPGNDVLHAGDAEPPAPTARNPVPDWTPTRWAPAAADVVDGGPGTDRLTYETRDKRSGVAVDLADGLPEGRPGEGDVVTGVEDVTGTDGDDRLRGDDGPNRLDGRGGSDELAGRGGDDHLETWSSAGRGTMRGGDGDDVLEPLGAAGLLDGGAGDDVLWGGWPAARCGPGHDLVIEGDAVGPRFGLSACERLRFGFSGGSGVGTLDIRRAGGRLALRLTCPRGVPACRTTVRSGRHTRSRKIAPGTSRTFPLAQPAGARVTVAIEVRLRGARLTPREQRPTRIRVTLAATT